MSKILSIVTRSDIRYTFEKSKKIKNKKTKKFY